MIDQPRETLNGGKVKEMEIKREHHVNFWYIIAAVIMVIVIQGFLFQPTQTEVIPYSEFEQLVDQGNVTDLIIGETQITGAFKNAKPNEPQRFSTVRVPLDLANKLTNAKLPFSGEAPPVFS